MAWNYRIVKQKCNEEENSFDVCEVYYNEEGNPTSYMPYKNVLSQDNFEDLSSSYQKIAKAYQAPVLEDIGEKLIELTTCPKCDNDVEYDIMDVMGDGNEEDFGKTVLYCSSGTCGYTATRQDYRKKNEKTTSN